MTQQFRQSRPYQYRNHPNGNGHSALPGDASQSTPRLPVIESSPLVPVTDQNGSAVPGTGPHTVISPPISAPVNAPPPQSQEDYGDEMLESFILPAERERLFEEKRKFESIKGLLLETINVLFREYHVRGLKFFRRRVEDSRTIEELHVASSMLLTLGKFHEVANPIMHDEDDQA